MLVRPGDAPRRVDQAGTSAAAQTIAPSDGPEPPKAPAVIARDANGLPTIRAVRVTTPLKIDGRLYEEVYATVPSMGDFVEAEPTDGAPAAERTDVWLLYDDTNLYVVARCWETHPERLVANEMRRDVIPVATSNDNFAFALDTYEPVAGPEVSRGPSRCLGPDRSLARAC